MKELVPATLLEVPFNTTPFPYAHTPSCSVSLSPPLVQPSYSQTPSPEPPAPAGQGEDSMVYVPRPHPLMRHG